MEKREPKRDEYRGNPLLVLPIGERNDFSFGVNKAKAIVEHIDVIRAFVAEHSTPTALAATEAARLADVVRYDAGSKAVV